MTHKLQPLKRVVLLLLVCSLLLSGCSSSTIKNSSQTKFDQFLDESFKTLVSSDSISLHNSLQHPENYDLKKEEIIILPDLSEPGMAQSLQTMKIMQKELSTFNYESLTEDQKRVALLLQDQLSLSIEMQEKYPYYSTNLGSNGDLSSFAILMGDYAFRDESDIKVYLKLLTKIPEYFDQIVSYEMQRQKNGLPLSQSDIDQSISHIDYILKHTDDENLYISTFRSRVGAIDFLDISQSVPYEEQNKNLVENTVIPAYKKMRDSLSKMKGSKDNKGIQAYPNGSDYYSLLLQTMVGTNRSPDGCIEALTAALDADTKALEQLNSDVPDLALEYACSLPAENDANKILTDLQNDILIEFPEINPVSYNIKEIPSTLASLSASAYYLVSPFDSEEAQDIYIKEISPVDLTLFSTLAHEGYPGHLYQRNYMYQNMYHPIQSCLSSNGYTEGWGTYAEYYSYDFMNYLNISEDMTKPLQQYSKLCSRQSLYLSCLTDLYVNYKGYDLKKLAEFLAPYGIDEATANSAYAYVIQNPCKYLTYGMGYYEFTDLLKQAQEKDNFSMEDFHNQVLCYGSCPFYLLSSFMEESQTSTNK